MDYLPSLIGGSFAVLDINDTRFIAKFFFNDLIGSIIFSYFLSH